MSIGQKASQGFFSFLTRNIISRVMGLISLFILARTLTPADFGLVSFTEILMYFIAVFGSTGLNEFLLAYKKDDYKEMIKSAFWFNMMLTILMMSIFFLAVPFWAASKHDNRIIWLGLISGISFFLTQLQVIPKAQLARNLDFKTTVKIQNPFIIIVPIAKILAALGGMGVYSITVPTLLSLPFQTLWFYKAIQWKLEWKLRRDRWREIYHFSKHLIGNSLLVRLMDDGDKLILSAFLGLESLGIYNMAYQLSSFVGLNIVSLTGSILTSVLPKYRNDLPKMKEHFLSFTQVLAFFTFPIILLMAVYAEPLIIATNGDKWLRVVVPFQILSIYALIRSVTTSRGAILNTLHLNKLSFKLNLIYAPIHILFSLVFAYYGGVIGVAISVVILRLIFGFIGMAQSMHAMQGQMKEFIIKIILPFKIILILIIPTFLLVHFIPQDFIYQLLMKVIHLKLYNIAAVIYFVLLFIIGLLFFIAIVRMFFKSEILDISNFLLQSSNKAGKIYNKVFDIGPSNL